MINKVKVYKVAFLIGAFLVSFDLKSQSPPFSPGAPAPYGCPTSVTYGDSYSIGAFNKSGFNVILNPVLITNWASYNVKARNQINIKPGSQEGPFSQNGSFHAYIEPSPIEVVSYHQSGFQNIPQYDKFELGIKLPQDLTDNINNFFGNTNTNTFKDGSVTPSVITTRVYGRTNGYGNVYNTTYINPYDPDKISVEATFSCPEETRTVYGFYYRDYKYIYKTGTNVTFTNTDWIEDTTLQYHWRVRFAPKHVGTYTVTWKVKTNNQTITIYEDNIGQTFNTISSDDRGFVKMGANGKFLVTQPNQGDGQVTIIPIGVCHPFPKTGFPNPNSIPPGYSGKTDSSDDVPYPDAPCFGTVDSYVSRFYEHRKEIKDRLAANDGNIVRIFNTAYSYNFEWEKLGVYDSDPKKPLGWPDWINIGISPNSFYKPMAFNKNYKGTNKQAILWEFDRLLDMAKEEDLYVQWVIDGMDNGFRSGVWDDNPYRLELNFDSNSVKEFFEEPSAIKAYQNRLRYMIARYGYSTNILTFEMFNELHFLNTQIGGTSPLSNVFRPWLNTMLNYIEGSYPSLNHNDHLFTVSFEDNHNDIGNQVDPDGDDIGTLTKLDFMSRHPYSYYEKGFSSAFSSTQYFKQQYLKPCQAGEMGIKPAWECINGDPFPEFMAPTFHSLLWSTTFIGGLTSGLDNWDGGLDFDPNTYRAGKSCGGGYINHFKPLRSFIDNINFDQYNYVPRYFLGDPLEAFYLEDNGGYSSYNAIGYIRNRTFWWTNFIHPNSGSQFYDPNLVSEYNNLYSPPPPCGEPCSPEYFYALNNPNPVLSGFLGAVQITGLNPNLQYVVEWFDTYTDPPQQIGTQVNFTPNQFGDGIIVPPNFSSTDCQRQEYAFKVKPLGARGNSENSDYYSASNTTQKKQGESIALNGAIFPNPSKGIYTIQMSLEDNYTVDVLNATGAKVKSFSFNGKQQNINIESLANGIYSVLIKGSNGTFAQKIIKQ